MPPLSITVLGSPGVDGIMELTEVSRLVEEKEDECAAGAWNVPVGRRRAHAVDR